MQQKHSVLGISSTFIWLTATVHPIYTFINYNSLVASTKIDSPETAGLAGIMAQMMMPIIIALLLFIIGCLVSLNLGLRGIKAKDKNIIFAKIGLSLSAFSLFIIIAPITFMIVDIWIL